MKSSMFYLWLVTGILGYGTKIPIVKKLIGFLSLWYGKTTIWKLLMKLRKLFVVFNALIGVVVVFKTTGFGVDTFWAHFAAMGTEYVIIFKNFVSRIFDWFLNLFDRKIVPNIPNNKPNNPSTYGWWTPRGIDYSWRMPLPKYDNPQALEWIKNPFQINYNASTPWYKDWSTLLWLGGFIGLLGLGYCGYKIYTDPMWFASIKGATATINPDNNQNVNNQNVAGGSLGQTIINTGKSFTKGFVTAYTGIRNTLNPFNWFTAASELERQNQLFMSRQASLTDAMDNRFYPFTEINPYRPWYTRLRILTLGETVAEYHERIQIRDAILFESSINIQDTRSLGSLTPMSGVGIGVKVPGILEATQTWAKIRSLPTTPNYVPSNLPESVTHPGGSTSWDTHKVDMTELDDHIAKAEIREIKGKAPEISTLSTHPLAEINPPHTGAVESTSVDSGSTSSGTITPEGNATAVYNPRIGSFIRKIK